MPETEAKVAEYKRANQLNIFANQARQAEEQKVQQKTAVAAPAPVVEQPAAGPTFTMFKCAPWVCVSLPSALCAMVWNMITGISIGACFLTLMQTVPTCAAGLRRSSLHNHSPFRCQRSMRTAHSSSQGCPSLISSPWRQQAAGQQVRVGYVLTIYSCVPSHRPKPVLLTTFPFLTQCRATQVASFAGGAVIFVNLLACGKR